jgi:AhpD family alkylhydroperoxidase
MSRLAKLDKNQGEPLSQEMMKQLDSQKMLLNIFRGMANSPAVLDGYLKFSGALKKGKLDARTREAIALVVGQTNRCDYCLAAHTMLGKGAGLDDNAVRDARMGRSADKRTNAAVVLAKLLLDKKGNVSQTDLESAREAGLNDGEIAEVVANLALNIFTNYFNHMNQTEVDLPKVAVDIS